MASTISIPNPPLTSHKIRTRRRPISASVASTSTVAARPLTSTAAPSSIALKTTAATVGAKTPLACMWREIQGAEDWDDLVQPLHPLLREEIVRYGESVAACYKVFDLDPSSKRYLNCKYGKNSMLREIGMASSGYEVTKYIYATPDISIPTQTGTCCSRWIGYVSVSGDEEARRLGRRDILVSFRGTVTNTEWIANFMSSLTPARLDPHDPRPDVKVESGFLSLYTSDDSSCKFSSGSCRQQLLSEVSRIVNKYKDEELSITLAGHSMGSSLALLLGYDLAELGLNRNGSNREVPITVYSFGGPRVGNSGFKERCEELGVKVLRVVNVNDPVTKLPGVFLNENCRVLAGRFELPWSCSCYAHVGVELALDFFKMRNPACVHDLDAYIGLLKGPKMAQVKKDGENLLNKAKKFLSSQNLTVWQWQDAARHVGDLVQSLGI
ncbi:phospholipase A1-Ialpha2, chloroplastic [Elaeis guineensis]|uniref:Phospholipase A1 EG1, chloroplastic/mitochondrial n=1 Tax=Elaeis guineensis var. tenera TaxID=51953 RepID=A0A6I9QT25_ELAGV|nr:phospholipase A1-Ialpha2, chloroplastic [Elaeis guineensis]